jgi:OmpA-OmpF porin, OOP family
VINGDFEKYHEPEFYEDFSADSWQNIYGSVDYYNINIIKTFDWHFLHDDSTFYSARSGNGYIGLIPVGINYAQEFIQGSMKSVLLKNNYYKISFWVEYPSCKAFYSTWKLGTYLSEDKILCMNKLPQYCEKSYKKYDYCFFTDMCTKKYMAQVENIKDNYLEEENRWVEISGIYKAIGGEKYITLGFFYNNDSITEVLTKVYAKSGLTKSNYKKFDDYFANYMRLCDPVIDYYKFQNYSYYFIDDVSVVQVDSNGNYIPQNNILDSNNSFKVQYFNIDSAEINKPIVLEDIHFSFNSSELTEESNNELNFLYDVLKVRLSYKISIAGYTDDLGSDEHNQKLSEERAKAVADYLIRKGIEKDRINYVGYGCTNPIVNNPATEEERAKNRRVEFSIIEK